MKRILSFILVIAMMLTVTPVTFAATSDGILKTGATAYTATVGDTISVPVYATATDGSDLVLGSGGQFDVAISSTDGVTIAFEGGLISSEDLRILQTDTSKVRAFWESDVTATSASPLFTVKYTITKFGTYTVTISDDVTVSASDVQYALDKVGATITVTAEPEYSAFVNNSTQVAIDPFTYADKVGTNISKAGISTITRNNTSDDFGSTAYVAADPDDDANYVLQVNKEAWTSSQPGSANEVEKTFNANCDSEYIVYSQRMKLLSAQQSRMRLRLDYKQKLNGGLNPEGAITHSGDSQNSPNLSIIFNNSGLLHETASNTNMGVAATAYNNQWVTLTLVIDAFDWSFDVYIGDTYYYTGSFANVAVSTDDYYISGIWKSEVSFDRGANKNGSAEVSAYYDDFEVRSISAQQANAADIAYGIAAPSGTFDSGAKLSTAAPLTGAGISWTTNNANVTVENGVVNINSAVEDGTQVEFTATFHYNTGDVTKKYIAIARVCPFRENSTQVAIEPFNYADKVGTNIREAGISTITRHKTDADYGSTAYVAADPDNDTNYVLQVNKENFATSADVPSNTNEVKKYSVLIVTVNT